MDIKSRLNGLTHTQLLELKKKINRQKLISHKPESATTDDNDIAVVGMSFRFPGGVNDIESYWSLLRTGTDAMDARALPRLVENNEAQRFTAGFIDDVDKFDAEFFKLTPKEAELMDPQHRLFLQSVWLAIEDAGYKPSAWAGTDTGVFTGICNYDYQELIQQQAELSTSAHSALGTSPSLIANRVSFWFDFKGPSQTVDTACSSSLVALHNAIKSLQQQECSRAIVGGVNLLLSPRLFSVFKNAGMLSPTNSCKTFDAAADGYARGEGLAALVLKHRWQAEQDGDNIYAILKGSAINHGGKAHSLTAPSPHAQAELIKKAVDNARIPVNTLGYIEAHGTGTELGDPIELDGLARAFAELAGRDQLSLTENQCALGSVKANIGHLEAAAGLSGLIKIIVCMLKQQLPPSVHFRELNPHIELKPPFHILSSVSDWLHHKNSDGESIPLRAGVSSFGFGGANAHVVVEQYAQRKSEDAPVVREQAFIFSAKTKAQLTLQVKNFAGYLDQLTDCNAAVMNGIAYTLQTGRESFSHRVAFIAMDKSDLLDLLVAYQDGDAEKAVWFSESVKATLGKKVKNTDAHIGQLLAQVKSWSLGEKTPWQDLYPSAPMRHHLPGYVFKKSSFWAPAISVDVAGSIAQSAFSTVYFATGWREQSLDANSQLRAKPRKLVLVSVFDDELDTLLESDKGLSKIDLSDNIAQDNDRHVAGNAYPIFAKVMQKIKDCIQSEKKYHYVFVVLSPLQQGLAVFPELAALAALLKTAALENPRISGKVIEYEREYASPVLRQHIKSELSVFPEFVEEVRYSAALDQRLVKHNIEITAGLSVTTAGLSATTAGLSVTKAGLSADENHHSAIKENGVYWITGGAGGLGRILAEHLSQYPCTLVLSGRAELSPLASTWLVNLQQAGANIYYYPCDVSDLEKTTATFQKIRQAHGHINGIFHSAGQTSDAYLLQKNSGDAEPVIRVKADGLIHLDLCSAQEDLDFIVAFSSIAANAGSVAQADYAYANAVMDHYMAYRSGLVQRGSRRGHSIAIQWPYWAEGGMQLSEIETARIKREWGMVPMPRTVGLGVLDKMLVSTYSQMLVIFGDSQHIQARFGVSSTASVTETPTGEAIDWAEDLLARETFNGVRKIISTLVKIPEQDIEPERVFEDFGIDSIIIGQINTELEKIIVSSAISKTLFFEYRTLQQLCTYLAETYPDDLKAWLAPRQAITPIRQSVPVINALTVSTADSVYEPNEPVAIIGLSGMYAGVRDLDELWQKLSAGDTLITEIPASRWDLRDHYCSDKEDAIASGKSYSKWGAFVNGVENFDSMFFNISPRDALNIDPQERKFLEYCWLAMEDASYTRKALEQYRVGVYGGITKTGFDLLRADYPSNDLFRPTTSFASLTNRVSHFFNFNGPSLPVDTMCSSSLSAIHLAAEHIQQGNCDIAFAGGVNFYLHPSNYTFLSRMRMLASDGKNKSFGLGGDGFVPGEGVGVIVLKRLSAAHRDKDHIYGVIRGSAINHGGKTSGYTVPNPNAQREVIRAAMARAGLPATAVSYIEAHGTGTELGDPIEITGLSQAFGYRQDDEQFCAIGSIKSNMGHLEAAAGIAGLTKILLQFRHRQLVPSINADVLNKNIDFASTPFKVQRKAAAWEPATGSATRLAGISSFGAGGGNAHLVVEEYIPGEIESIADTTQGEANEYLFVFSAKSKKSLLDYLASFNRYLLKPIGDSANAENNTENTTASCYAIAYGLWHYREKMEYRCAFIAANLESLRANIDAALRPENHEKSTSLANQVFFSSSNLEITTDSSANPASVGEKNQLALLALGWCRERTIDGSAFFATQPARKIPLPGYVFEQRRIWPDEIGNVPAVKSPHIVTISTDKQVSNMTSNTEQQAITGADRTVVAARKNSHETAIARISLDAIELKSLSAFDQVSYAKGQPPGEKIDLGPLAVIPAATIPPEPVPFSTQKNREEKEQNAMQKCLLDLLGGLLCIDKAEISLSNTFAELGFDSILAVEFIKLIQQSTGIKIDVIKIYDYSTVPRLAAFLVEKERSYTINSAVKMLDRVPATPLVAVVPPTSPLANREPVDSRLAMQKLTSLLAKILFLDVAEIGTDTPFAELGLDSVNGVEFTREIAKAFSINVSATSLYNYPSLDSLLNYLLAELASSAPDDSGLVGNVHVDVTMNVSQGGDNNRRELAVIGEFYNEVCEYFISSIAELLFLNVQDVSITTSFGDLGIDSINGVEWIRNINHHFSTSLTIPRLYDYPTIDLLARHLASQRDPRLDLPASVTKNSPSRAPATTPIISTGKNNSVSQQRPSEGNREIFHRDSSPKGDRPGALPEKIAIIGMSGQFPGATNVDQFWSNLVDGVDSVVEVPGSRWDVSALYGNKNPGSKSINSKWLGALQGVDQFDPLFFNISPLEAECMDPQQRLLLEESWRAFEDAGYSSAQLSSINCGAYIGIMANDYWHVLEQNKQYLAHAQTMTGNSNAISAARISYFLNLRGPAIALDTACSSSLVGTHLACQALRQGEIDMALVGGATVYLSSDGYVQMCEAGMLSPSGHCHTFDNNADGFVPGEAAACIILKRLVDAERDGDHIYGVISGSGINQDGKTNGITAPSSNSQYELIKSIYQKYAIDPTSISYIEAHGTGTKLGDPIEIDALTHVFRDYTSERGICGIGSVKSNIGHTSAAAGVVSLQKILLAMRHKKIPASIHFSRGNEHIDFGNSPFFVTASLQPWSARRAGEPLRAAVSSFGFSGTNAHVVVDEYIPSSPVAHAQPPEADELIVVSAMQAEVLDTYLAKLATYLRSATEHLGNIAYTLQYGRTPMEYRVAFVARDKRQLLTQINTYLEGNKIQQGIYVRDPVEQLADPQAVARAITQHDLQALAAYWVGGASIDWLKLKRNLANVARVSLPTYPFNNNAYWVPLEQTQLRGGVHLHPLVHKNISTLQAQKFLCQLSGDENILIDHRVHGKKVLPGAAQIEMARFAASISTGQDIGEIRNIHWLSPVVVERDLELTLLLSPRDANHVHYTLCSEYNGNLEQSRCHSSGEIVLSPQPLRSRQLTQGEGVSRAGNFVDVTELYEALKQQGINYGHSFRIIKSLQHDQLDSVATIVSPASDNAVAENPVVLNVEMLDAALQAVAPLVRQQAPEKLFLPYSIGSIAIGGALSEKIIAHVRRQEHGDAQAPLFDVDIFDEGGELKVSIKDFLLRAAEAVAVPRQSPPAQVDNSLAPSHPEQSPELVEFLKQRLSGKLKIPAGQINERAPLEKYGIDSVMIIALTDELERVFGELSKTLFFECQTLVEVARYLELNHPSAVVTALGKTSAPSAGIIGDSVKRNTLPPVAPTRFLRPQQGLREGSHGAEHGTEIAIIGVSGTYPQADDLAAFWQNLIQGKDCITEIPESRWSSTEFYSPEKKEGHIHGKWGGFINDIDKFDSLFFNISPVEAEIMDPQERLFLQCAWQTLEDAGYTPENLLCDANLAHRPVGVFVGVMYEEYQLYGAQEQARGRLIGTMGNASGVANRVSYYFNFHGPSMAVDTMCSSSISSIHLACQSLLSGQCQVALAGGVNLSVHPNKYVLLSQGNFLSTKGRCESFGEGGDGYVPGEGVGCLLLKPLAAAERDGDNIYGVIKGSAINHGGKTNGYTVPNPVAQTRVIASALQHANVDARAISYIEAHGTGTSLGDPIEITALGNAFSEHGVGLQQCAIGSVKSNIGHCESAAGVAGITKVLLQMRAGKLAPSIHTRILNAKIPFEKTAFKVQRELAEWHRPVVDGKEQPRIAGVSSFGAGGSNAHIILAEYVAPAIGAVASGADEFMLPLSARKPSQLIKNAQNLHAFLLRLVAGEDPQGVSPSIGDIAYTLQTGRKPMEHRLAIIGRDLPAIIHSLEAFISGQAGDFFAGHTSRNDHYLYTLADDEDFNQTLARWLQKGKMRQLGELWVKGFDIDWAKLYLHQARPRKVSLPTYAFEKVRHWLNASGATPALNSGYAPEQLHPLVHVNHSRFNQQRFSTVFHGDETLLKDHIIGGRIIMPGVAYLEMARAAVELSCSQRVIAVKNILWAEPIYLEGKARVDIGLDLISDSNIVAQVSTAEKLHAKMVVITAERLPVAPALETVGHYRQAWDQWQSHSGAALYNIFATRGFHYGNSYRGLDSYILDNQRLVARYSLKVDRQDALKQDTLKQDTLKQDTGCLLDPRIFDCALQACAGVIFSNPLTANDPGMFLPFSIEQVNIFAQLPAAGYVTVELAESINESKSKYYFNVNIYDEQGKCCLQLHSLCVKAVNTSPALSQSPAVISPAGSLTSSQQEARPVYANWEWIAQDIVHGGAVENTEYWLYLLNMPDLAGTLDLGENCIVRSFSISSADDMADSVVTMYSEIFTQIKEGIFRKRTGKNIRLIALSPSLDTCHAAGALSGLFKTCHLENARVHSKNIYVNDIEHWSAQQLGSLLTREALEDLYAAEVFYDAAHIRHTRRLTELDPGLFASAAETTRGGVYWITGGMGGLGKIFANHIGQWPGSTIILSGRSPLNEQNAATLSQYIREGLKVIYKQIDVEDAAAVARGVAEICAEYGGITGIIHSAGVLRDGMIANKTHADITAVFGPKITGLHNIDRCTKDLKLDFLVLFSSVAGVFGNMGQADYSGANAYLDAFAGYRNQQVLRGERAGQTISINWPLWKEGGMRIDKEIEKRLEADRGVRSLTTAQGLSAFDFAVTQSAQTQLVILAGNKNKIYSIFNIHPRTSGTGAVRQAAQQKQPALAILPGVQQGELRARIHQLCAGLLHISPQDIDIDADLAEYGVDSIQMMKLLNILENELDVSLEPTVIIDNPSIAKLATSLEKYTRGNVQPIYVGNTAIQPSPALYVETAAETAIAAEPVATPKNVASAQRDAERVFVEELKLMCAALLNLSPDEFDAEAPFTDYGMDSILVMKLMGRIESRYNRIIQPNAVIENATIAALAHYLIAEGFPVSQPDEANNKTEFVAPVLSLVEKTDRKTVTEKYPGQFMSASTATGITSRRSTDGDNRIAVIGMSCRLPQSATPEDFWKHLSDGRELISDLPPERWNLAEVLSDDREALNKAYTCKGGYIDNIGHFDADYFGIAREQAAALDPQQRLALQLARELFADAGYTQEQLRSSSTSVILGAKENNYVRNNYGYLTDKTAKRAVVNSIGNMIAARIADFYDLRGSAKTIDTACSSSLVAIHDACQNLLLGESDMAVAGGIFLLVDPFAHVGFSQADVLSPDGRCYVFDERAQGLVLGEGAGLVLLKRYVDARRDGDNILGVISGSAVNNDGKTIGLTVPNLDGQKAVIRKAVERSGVDVRDIGFYEAHGTGTLLGDPIEVKAATEVYGEFTGSKQYCALGSVKSNLGHTMTAAGVTSLIKVLLSIKNKQFPASLNCERAHPRFRFEETPFFPNTSLRDWQPPPGKKRTAAISSFGFGGTNCHMIVEEET